MTLPVLSQLRALTAAFLAGCSVGAVWDGGACLLRRSRKWLRIGAGAVFLLLASAGIFVLAMATGDVGVRTVFLIAALTGLLVYRMTLCRWLRRLWKRLRRRAGEHNKKISVF